MPRALNEIAAYYDVLVRAAAEHIDEHLVLQVTDFDVQRSIFVAVCQAMQRSIFVTRIEPDFNTFRSRVCHAYKHSGLPQRFPSRVSQLPRIRLARTREAGGRARSAPAKLQTTCSSSAEPMYIHCTTAAAARRCNIQWDSGQTV